MFAMRWFIVIVFIILLALITRSDSHARTWHVDKRTPCDIMVDVVNDLGLNLLKIHNLNNENNIALSPYGVASILTALLEGVQGRAALEIQKCGGFPANRDVVRVGLRDIHRLLRSYFIPQEGFLSGLSLSSEKVILKPEYQSILRFYGFDMTSFNTPIYPNLSTTTPINNSTITDSVPTTEIPTTQQTETTTNQPETTIAQETTLPPTTTTTIITTIQPQTTTVTEEPTTIIVVGSTLPTEVETTTIPATTPIPETTTTASETTQTTVVTTTEVPTTEVPTTQSPETTTSITTTAASRRKRSIVDYFIARFYDGQSPEIYSHEDMEQKHEFLVNGRIREPHVHFMTYEAILPFFYIHNLNALALRFPLDSPKYYLLLVLPVDDEGIDRLICNIGNSITLKQIVSHLRPTFVRAVIPSFMLRGFVILTSSLQKIGIRQIFEPHQSDFSPMTDDRDIYVTNIEQAITVMIKNYMEPGMFNKNRNEYQYGPVDFKATHPFLYFVIDSEIDVTLVAGKIVNPINSRIQ